jgi:protein TonB
MESKKSNNANLEKKRAVFFSLGIILSSSLILMAFTYSSAIDNTIAQEANDHQGLIDIIYETPEKPEEPERKPEKVVPQPKPIDIIKIVKNDVIIDTFEFVWDVDTLPPDDDIDTIISEPIYDVVGIEPKFPVSVKFPEGGEPAMMDFVQSNVVYPLESVEMGEQGIVYVQFVVNTDGSISDVVAARGISENLDREAIKVVKAMPKWIPGEQAGKKVRVRYTIPINFKLS